MKLIYPGSFDPVTNGHLDIIKRASLLSDGLIVAVLDNKNKSALFSVEERVDLLEKATEGLKKVKIESFSGLLVEYLNKVNTYTVVRGLRALSDYENEMQNALANNNLNKKVETIFMVSKTEYTFLSSSLVKEIASFGGAVDGLVPENVSQALMNKYNNMEDVVNGHI